MIAIVAAWIVLLLVVTAVIVLIRRRMWLPVTVWVFVVSVVLLVAGTGLGLANVERLKKYVATAHWPSVEGTVVSSEVAGDRAFFPKITYRYTVNGVAYTGVTDFDVPGFGTRFSRLDVAEKVVNEFPPNTPVHIHYDPKNPQDSRLRTTPPWNVFVQMSLGVMLTIMGTFGTVGYLVRRQKSDVAQQTSALQE